MAIVKITRSGKGILFIDDDGNVYVTSLNFFLGLREGKSKTGFVLLKRLPTPASASRFQKSPIWDPDGIIDERTLDGNTPTRTNDGLSANQLKKNDDKKVYTDKVIDYGNV